MRFKAFKLIAAAALAALAFTEAGDGVPAGAESLTLPGGEEIEIIRDGFGVPHVYADSSEAVSYGAGYALAQDRLFQMEALRKIAKGQLSDLLGVPNSPIRPGLLEQDREVRFFTYTQEERAAKYATYPEDVRRNIEAFVDGINAWMLLAQLPENRPGECVEFAACVDPWTVDDTIALGDVLILAFGSGGGGELGNAALLNFLVQKYGQGAGLKAFKDAVWTNDPDSPPSIPPEFHWKQSPTYARLEADSSFKLNLHLTDARLGLSGPGDATSTADTDGDSLDRLLAGLPLFSDEREAALGTDPYLDCAADNVPHNEAPDPQPEDLNDDRFVDISDVTAVTAAFGLSAGSSGFERRTDLNLDSSIDISDIAIITGTFGSACVSSLPTTEDAALLEQLALVPDFGPVEGALDLLDGLESFRASITFGSNAQIVSPWLAEAGNSLQTGGPQVGYLVPQFLVDIGLHGGDFDATGMTFAGAGPAVLIGRGKGYAWTTTTGASDLTDTYVEKLNPDNPRQYLFRGAWEDMDCRTETYTFRGVAQEQEEICRTRHGPVLAFDEANDVAYSLKYGWFNAEKGTVEGFFGYNKVKNLEDFATFANFLTSNHNMFYSDDQGNSGYWHPGAHPLRQPFVDLRLPQDGTGKSEWRGIRPAQDVPHAVNFQRGWLANWNNKPSVDWDREVGWGAVHKVRSIFDVLDPSQPRRPGDDGAVINPDGALSWDDLSANLRYAAFREHDADFFLPFLPATGADAQEDQTLAVIRSWDRFLTDRDANCHWDSSGATIFQRWRNNMRSLAFADDLETQFGRSSTSMLLHVLQGNGAALKPRFDWLGGESPSQLAARALSLTVDQLAAEFGSAEPAAWMGTASYQHYTRLNADLAADAVRSRSCPYQGSVVPGDIPDHVRMDRGTYNHVVAYLDPPAASGALGQISVRSGSVIPPGQSGFINSAGVESPPGYPATTCAGGHYRDQFDDYANWTYKPMPMTHEEAVALQECAEVITR